MEDKKHNMIICLVSARVLNLKYYTTISNGKNQIIEFMQIIKTNYVPLRLSHFAAEYIFSLQFNYEYT